MSNQLKKKISISLENFISGRTSQQLQKKKEKKVKLFLYVFSTDEIDPIKFLIQRQEKVEIVIM